MSFFNFFGVKNKKILPSMAIQNMKETLDTLEKREKFLETRITVLKNEAKSLVSTNKRKAIYLIKKAKINEKQLLSIYGQKENIETQIYALEQGVTNQNVISSMIYGKNAIEQITSTINPDNIDQLMDNINASIDSAEEVSNAMSSPIGQVYDDDDLFKELEDEVGNKQNNEEKYTKLSISDLPEVPVNTVLSRDENELKELNELMSM